MALQRVLSGATRALCLFGFILMGCGTPTPNSTHDAGSMMQDMPRDASAEDLGGRDTPVDMRVDAQDSSMDLADRGGEDQGFAQDMRGVPDDGGDMRDGAEDLSGAHCDDLLASFEQRPTSGSPPPYSGTVWYDRNIITSEDPTSFQGLTYRGEGERTMFDRRTNSFTRVEARLYDAEFGATSKRIVEIQVNPEFDEPTARQYAEAYAEVIGRLPAFLFRDLKTVWIHDGNQLFGGGNNNLLIHTKQGENYIADGVLEEVFLHEGAHTSLDAYHASDATWLEAQRQDGQFISDYARDNPLREDVSETIGPFLAITYRADRLDPAKIEAVREAIPNRITYLLCQPEITMEILD